MSLLLRLINEFSARQDVPVEVDEVVAYLTAHGVTDEIYFFDADMDTHVLQGFIHHWEYVKEGWTYKVADIYTAKSLSPEEKRIVQVKELLHILDPRTDRANTPEEVNALIRQMALPASSLNQNGSDHAMSDWTGVLYALAVLFPSATRSVFMAPFSDGRLDINRIANAAALPLWIAQFVMDDIWGTTSLKLMTALAAQVQVPDRIHTFDHLNNPIEVSSVPLEEDPFVYAKRLEEKYRGKQPSIAKVIIETRRDRRSFTRDELVAYTLRSPIRASAAR